MSAQDLLNKWQDQNAATSGTANKIKGSSALVSQWSEQRDRAVDSTLSRVAGGSADQAAQAQKLSRQTGLPLDTVERDQDKIAPQARARELRDMMRLNPVLKQHLADPNFAKIAHDDAESLAGIEEGLRGRDRTLFEATAGPLRSGYLRTVRGLTATLADQGLLYQDDPTGLAVRLAELQRQIDADAPSDAVEAGMRDISGAEGFGEALGAIIENPQAVGEVVLQSLGGTAPALMLAAAGSTISPFGTAAGAGMGSFAIEYSNTLQEAITEAGGDPTNPQDIDAALQDEEAMERARLKGVKRGLPIAAFDALTAGLAGRLLAGAKATVPSVAGRAAGEVGLQAGGGAAGEATAQALTDEFRPGDILLEAIAELPTAAVEAPGNYIGQMKKARSAERNAAMLDRLGELSKASKVRGRDADTFEKYVEQAAQDGPVQDVFIDGQTLMQSGVADQIAEVSPSVAAQLPEAAASGGSVRIPIAEYTARIAGTEFNAQLLDHLRTEPDGFSRTEANAFLENQQEELEQEVTKALKDQGKVDEFQASAQQVEDYVFNQLQSAGRFTDDVSRADAALHRHFFATMALNMGESPKALFDRYALNVRSEGVGAFNQRRTSVGVDPSIADQSVVVVNPPFAQASNTESSAALDQLRETPVNVEGLGAVTVTAKDIGKLSSQLRHLPERHVALASLPALLESAVVVDTKPDRAGKREDFKYAVAAINMNGEPASVLLEFRKPSDAAGRNLYHLSGYTIEASGAMRGGTEPGGQGQAPTVTPSAELTVGALVEAVNADNRFFQGSFDQSGEEAASTDSASDTELFKLSGDTPRGSFNPDTNTISLLQNADLSTFLHESAHFFLEVQFDVAAKLQQEAQAFGYDVLEPGKQRILQDTQALLDWFGVPDLNTWGNLSLDEKRSYHEKLAESFERYLLEGKAPSIELQPLFQRFRSWMLAVYRSLKNMLAQNDQAGTLSDDVRRVFDRMLATDEQIQLAQQSQSMVPLFETAEQAGMTPEEFAAYQSMDPQATADAQEELQTRGLRDMKWLGNARNKALKKLQREAAAQRREVRSAVRTEVMSEPVYRAWHFLTRKLGREDKITPTQQRKSKPDVLDPTIDSLFVAIAKLGGLDKQEVIETWGTDSADKPQSGVFGKPVWRLTKGRSIDAMAEVLAEQGYLPVDQHGKADISALEERFDAELRGDRQYSRDYVPTPEDEGQVGDNIVLEALGAGRLDRTELIGLGIDEETRNRLDALKMTARDGLHPDLVADLFGFDSGDAMVQALAEATPMADEIEGRTDQRMLEQFGDLASDEAIERAADAAVHNDARGRMVATEANALAKATGSRRVLIQAAKAFAQAVIGRKKIRDIRPSEYSAAEARAARNAEKAMRQNDLDVAAAEKRNQVISRYTTRAAHDAREESVRLVRYLRKFERDGTRKNLDPEYMDQIDALLERFELRQVTLREIDKREALAAWLEKQELAGLEPDIPSWIADAAQRTHYKNLTMEQLRGLTDSVKQIEHLGRLKNKLLTAQDNRRLDQIVADITARIEESSGGREVDNEARDTLGSKATQFGRWALATHRKAASLVREMDGFQDGGPFWEYFIRSMNAAGEREASMRADASKRLYEIAKPVLALGKMGGKGRFFESLNRSLNRGERLAVALNWGNDGNRQRLLGGKSWTAEQLVPVLQSLTKAEWDFVQGVWDFFESYRPEIAAKERRVYGKEPDWIEPSAFAVNTADGQTVNVRGGYYPIKYDPNQSGAASEFTDAEDAKAMMRAAHTASTTRRSFTKNRAEEVSGRPLLLTFDGIWQGANEVIHDLAWHEWLIDANRLLRRVDSAVRTHYGAQYAKELRDSVKDTARGDAPAANVFERSLNRIRIGSTITGLGWNLTTALLQPLGLSNSIVRIGGVWVAKGLGQFYSAPIRMAGEVQEKSEFMRNRARTMQREINDVQNQLKGKSPWRQAVDGSFFILIQKLQAMVDYPTWLGAYEKAVAQGNDDARATDLADQAVKDAQGGGQIHDLAKVQRGAPALKLFTNFYSFFNVVLNLSAERTKATDFKSPAQVAALAGDYLLLMIFPAVAGAMLRAAVKGELDDDDLVEKVASEQISFLMGMFVGLREASGAAQKLAGVGYPFNYGGPAGLRLFGEMDRLAQQMHQGDADMALFKAANNTAGILFHYPAGQINRAVEGTAALVEGKSENPLAPLVGPSRN